MRRRRRSLAVLVLGALAVAACGGDGGTRSVNIPNVFDLAADPTVGISEAPSTDVASAGALRNTLDLLLAWHGVTLVQTVRAIEADSPDTDAWVQALSDNTDDLVSAVGSIYGKAGAFAFYQQWAQHTQFLADYAQAVRDGDDDARDAAAQHLVSYATDSGHFFASATAGGLPADAVTELLTTHVGHIQAVVDALAADDTPTALSTALEDNGYLSTIAGGLAQAFAGQFPDRYPGSADEPVPAFCTLAVAQTGDYLLRTFFSDTPDVTTDATFETNVGAPLTQALGPLDGLVSPEGATRVRTADTALQNAFTLGRAGA